MCRVCGWLLVVCVVWCVCGVCVCVVCVCLCVCVCVWFVREREEEMRSSDVFDMLSSLADFDTIKEIMLSHRQARAPEHIIYIYII